MTELWPFECEAQSKVGVGHKIANYLFNKTSTKYYGEHNKQPVTPHLTAVKTATEFILFRRRRQIYVQ
jgi:hypothetical protein